MWREKPETVHQPGAGSATQAPVAIIANSLPPYRIHVHRRIAEEIPEVRLWSISTHDAGDGRWQSQIPPCIHPVLLGQGQSPLSQDRPSMVGREWRKAGRIIELLKKQNVQAVLINGYNDVGRLRIFRWCRKNKVPCFLAGDSNIRSDSAQGIKAVLKHRLLTKVISWCDAVLPCGRLGEAYFTKYGAAPERIFLFPYEPDYDLIRQLPADFIEQVRRRFGLCEYRRRMVFSGRMVRDKRPDLIVDAFVTIAQQRPEWDLLMVGEGVLRDPLQCRIPPALRHRVVWTGFLSDQSAVSALYRLSDLLVLPSDYEPWALVINEAAAAGLAIVASHMVGAAAELVQENVNGRTFPRGNLEELKKRLLEVTAPGRIDAMKAASPVVLAKWRRIGDPIEGFRRALRRLGVI